VWLLLWQLMRRLARQLLVRRVGLLSIVWSGVVELPSEANAGTSDWA
jgi:hypothetical protein